ncbi:MAG: hypothetical protein ACRC6R_08005 [Bacteroidales bacterium]
MIFSKLFKRKEAVKEQHFTPPAPKEELAPVPVVFEIIPEEKPTPVPAVPKKKRKYTKKKKATASTSTASSGVVGNTYVPCTVATYSAASPSSYDSGSSCSSSSSPSSCD